jgi:6-phosphogluconate dehydrogenase
MDLLYDAFCKKPKLDDVETTIHSSSACIDAINSAMKLNVPVPMMGITLLMRQRTQQQETFSARIVNSLRKEIGGYKPKK